MGFVLYESVICVLISAFGLASTRFKFLELKHYVFIVVISALLVLTRYFFSKQESRIRLLSLPSSLLVLFLSLPSPKLFLISFVALYIFSIEIFSPFEFGKKIPFLIKPVIFVVFYFLGFYYVANPFSFATYDALYYALLIAIFGLFFSLSQKHFAFGFPAVLTFPIFHSSLPVIALSGLTLLSLFFMRKEKKNFLPSVLSLFFFVFVILYLYDAQSMLPAGAIYIFFN
jgi:hypothetical protein